MFVNLFKPQPSIFIPKKRLIEAINMHFLGMGIILEFHLNNLQKILSKDEYTHCKTALKQIRNADSSSVEKININWSTLSLNSCDNSSLKKEGHEEMSFFRDACLLSNLRAELRMSVAEPHSSPDQDVGHMKDISILPKSLENNIDQLLKRDNLASLAPDTILFFLFQNIFTLPSQEKKESFSH